MMKVLLDMNLPPAWVRDFRDSGFDAVHWSEVGDLCATDAAIMEWAREQQRIVLTHDLDFSALLAATQAVGPSVVQVRAQDVTSPTVQRAVIETLKQQEELLLQGALISVDPIRARVRILPLLK